MFLKARAVRGGKMNKSMRDTNEIEATLKKLPKINDHRSAQMIYMEVNQSKEIQGKKHNRFRYVFVSAVAIMIFVIISSTILLNEQHSSEERSSKSSDISEEYKVSDIKETSLRDDATSNVTGFKEGEVIEAVQTSDVRLLYPSDVNNNHYFTLAVPTLDVQYLVPFTIKLESNSMEQNINRLKEVEGMINEASFGLADYFPLNAQFSYLEEANAVIVDVPSENDYLYHDRVFLEMLRETFMYQDIDKIIFKTEGSNGIEFSHMGLLEEDEVVHHRQRAIYLYQYDEQSPGLFVSSINQYDDITIAFEAMKQGDDPVNEAISTTIPASIQFDMVEENGRQLIITFSNDTVLENSKQYELAIAAMLLAAREFDFQTVLFRNGKIDTVGPFNLNEELEVPIAPNLIEVR